MREDDGRKLDHKVLERMRFRAVKQIEAGARVEDIAAGLGLHRSTVFGWMAAYREGGKRALSAKPVPGPKPKLSARHYARLYALIKGSNPAQLELDLGIVLWTRRSVRALILREFKVDLSEVSVGRLLHQIGMSPQRPTHRAYEADPAAQEAWRTKLYPELRAEAHKLGASIFFADEASVRSDFHSGTTWAPVGKTPVVVDTGSRVSVNMISAISPRGQLHFKLIDGSMNSAAFIDYCTDLLHDIPGPIFLVVDGASYHHSKAVKAHLEQINADGPRLRIYQLPAYSPQLNPDEWIWRHVKGHQIGRMQILDKGTLQRAATKALQYLKDIPVLVRGIFKDPHLQYITA